MFKRIARRRSIAANRVFPSISRSLYSLAATATPEGAAGMVLQMSQQTPSVRERRRDRRDPAALVARLLSLHSRALDAETGGDFPRADFFWNEVRRVLKRLEPGHRAWVTVAAQVRSAHPESPLAVPDELRRRVRDELLIDTHLACMNGGPNGEWLSHGRGATHIRLGTDLLKNEANANDRTALPRSVADAIIENATGGKNWDRCISACRDVLPALDGPERHRYAEMLADFLFSRTMESLKGMAPSAPEHVVRSDTAVLKAGIRELEELRSRHAGNASAVDALGQLYLGHAIALGRLGDLAEALEAVERALAFRPYDNTAQQSRIQLAKAMDSLAQSWRQTQQQIRSNPNAVLTADGHRIKHQAKMGFKLSKAFANSAEPDAIRKDSVLGTGHRFWLALDMPTDADQWSVRAVALRDALNAVVSTPGLSHDTAPGIVRDTMKRQPELRDLPTEHVIAFVQARLAGRDWTPPQRDDRVGDDVQELKVPAKLVSVFKRRPPFATWLGSGQHLGLKVQMAAAAVLLLVAAGVGWIETNNRNHRDTAFTAAVAAYEREDWANVLGPVQEFLEVDVFADSDRRVTQLVNFYTEALVRLATENGPDDPIVQRHLEHYRSLSADQD